MNIVKTCSRNESVQSLRTLVNLNRRRDDTKCHVTYVNSKKNVIVYSECDKRN